MFFALLSLFYVAAIFILAGSPIARELTKFNPYSLLHIPLYGIMTFRVVFAIVPVSRAARVVGDPAKLQFVFTNGLTVRLLVAGAIALAVGILDEIHQLYVPGRDGSAGDVMLDTLGIVLALILCSLLFKTSLLRKRPTGSNR